MEQNISRREALGRMGLGLLGLSLLGLGLPSCTAGGRHPDQHILCNRCDGCGACRCPYGVDVAANLTLYNREAAAGRLPDPREGGSSHYRSEGRRFLGRLDGIPRLAQADRCISCQRCVGVCPQRVDIPRALHQMESLVQKLKDDGIYAQ